MSFSLSGLSGSTFDWRSMLDQLSQVEQSQKITPLNTQKTSAQNKKDAWSSVGSMLSSLNTAVAGLKDASAFSVYKASTTSDSTSITADSLLSATAGTTAGKGRYDLQVTSIAKGDHYQSTNMYSSTDTPIASGAITINGQATADMAGKTLSEIRDAINGLNSGTTPTGVTASILQVSSTQSKLLLTADGTGTTASGGKGQITVASPSSFIEAAPIAGMSASDAVMTVNGTQVTRTTNSITDVIPGVTLDLKKAEPAGTPVHVTLDVAQDTDSIKKKVQTFIDAYNTIIDYTNKQMTYNGDTKSTGGVLFGDNTLKSIKNSLQDIALSAASDETATASSLSTIGITIDANNKLTMDSTKFQSALGTDPSKTLALFNDLGQTMDAKLDRLTDSIDGTVTVEQKTQQSNMDNLDKKMASRQLQIDSLIARMTTQFINMDSAYSQMQSQASSISSLLA